MTSLSCHQRMHRLRIARDCAARGASRQQLGVALGMRSTSALAFLFGETGYGGWPPEQGSIEAAIAALEGACAAAPEEKRNSFSAEREALSRTLTRANEGPRLSDEEIYQRRDAVSRERASREAALLEEEQRRYKLPRRGIPLSRMPV